MYVNVKCYKTDHNAEMTTFHLPVEIRGGGNLLEPADEPNSTMYLLKVLEHERIYLKQQHKHNTKLFLITIILVHMDIHYITYITRTLGD